MLFVLCLDVVGFVMMSCNSFLEIDWIILWKYGLFCLGWVLGIWIF